MGVAADRGDIDEIGLKLVKGRDVCNSQPAPGCTAPNNIDNLLINHIDIEDCGIIILSTV
jgi:hypothetical protein